MKPLLLLLISLNILSTDLTAYRKLLDGSLKDEDTSKRFYELLKTVKEDEEPIFVGFRAMSEFMLCNHVLNPLSKLSHFKKGRKLLEGAIKRDNLNPELLFFRLSTQSNVPALLGYKMNIEEDKLALISYLRSGLSKTEDKALYGRVKAYLLINQYCSSEEKAMIKKL